MSEHDAGHIEAWKGIVALAQDMLDGRMEPIAGVRAIRVLARQAGALDDAAIIPLLGVASETDHMPRGESRLLYTADYLQRSDTETAAYLTLRKEYTLNACRELVAAHN